MTGAEMMQRFVTVIDDHDWEGLARLLHEDFRCHLVHTGEMFGKEEWVRFNADYPGFERMVLEDCVSEGERAVGRASVTGTSDGRPQRFAVASFVTLRDGLIVDLTEVWTDVGLEAPAGTRLA
ncbi:nuclear transport factor 2 family protein [Ornithinimicrobium sp. F0845]|uniref:nuclear transport factor 2 family protein n=1 Tax=Ornithinimicrobium sp. F0845 TaxID=2926412 RepID=UPI001FF63449|nr:nuclear transport factor 2 family protein [Ornithinimicrobium sp. F0845]MCK0111649.1 nuclear transport factor 2 family protein [Ornithinimicrobium sp. F0845]